MKNVRAAGYFKGARAVQVCIMNGRLFPLVGAAGVILGLLGCESAPMRGSTGEAANPSGAPTSAGMGVTGPNSTSSAAGPGTATGASRGGSR